MLPVVADPSPQQLVVNLRKTTLLLLPAPKWHAFLPGCQVPDGCKRRKPLFTNRAQKAYLGERRSGRCLAVRQNHTDCKDRTLCSTSLPHFSRSWSPSAITAACLHDPLKPQSFRVWFKPRRTQLALPWSSRTAISLRVTSLQTAAMLGTHACPAAGWTCR